MAGNSRSARWHANEPPSGSAWCSSSSRVLLHDEPTSALDPERVGEVLEVVSHLAVEDGLTMIISTHQLRFAKDLADRVVFLSNGSATEGGPAIDDPTQTQADRPLPAGAETVAETPA
jgi:ABC-type polar amino acid transport system ATPase subunit